VLRGASDPFLQLFKVYSSVPVGTFSKRYDPLNTNSGIHSRKYLCSQDILLVIATDAILALSVIPWSVRAE
jgi:hypothetical protein